MSTISTFRSSRTIRLLLIIVPLLGAGLLFYSQAYGVAELTNRSLQFSDNRPSHIASYKLSFTIPSTETLGSIELQVCTNSSLQGDPCTAPTGFDISSATLGNQSGETGFTVLSSATNANTIVLTRVPTATTPDDVVSYTFDNVTNPSMQGSFFGRIQTFASTDATGVSNDFGGLALSINSEVDISTVVPPYLLFCSGLVITGFDCSTASGNYVNFGNLSSATTATATTQAVTATNASNGFVMQVYGTTMTSGNNIIAAISNPDVSRPGTAQFGLNLVANTTPTLGADPQGAGSAAVLAGYNKPDFFKFVSGDAVISAPTSDDFRKFTFSYILNIPNGQPIGVYATTLTFVSLANF